MVCTRRLLGSLFDEMGAAPRFGSSAAADWRKQLRRPRFCSLFLPWFGVRLSSAPHRGFGESE